MNESHVAKHPLTTALVLLAAWVVALLVSHGLGSIVHVLLLVGLMVLLLAVLKERDQHHG